MGQADPGWLPLLLPVVTSAGTKLQGAGVSCVHHLGQIRLSWWKASHSFLPRVCFSFCTGFCVWGKSPGIHCSSVGQCLGMQK